MAPSMLPGGGHAHGKELKLQQLPAFSLPSRSSWHLANGPETRQGNGWLKKKIGMLKANHSTIAHAKFGWLNGVAPLAL